MPTVRGTFQFEVNAAGDLLDSLANAERLRAMWLDRSVIDGANLGPGNPGDFDHGAWHVGCHVVAAGGVRRLRGGRLAWLEISHEPVGDSYYGSVTCVDGARSQTRPLDDPASRRLLDGSTLLGFVEGNSTGHVSARNATDPPARFNGWSRQGFDQSASSDDEGGKVWEHWCTLRDLRTPDPLGASVVRAYVSLVAALGDRFAPSVARGRRQYGHPRQLCAFVRAGFTDASSATWDITPVEIPAAAELLLNEARPAEALQAVSQLAWGTAPQYYMFKRRIGHWSSTAAVRDDLRRY